MARIANGAFEFNGGGFCPKRRLRGDRAEFFEAMRFTWRAALNISLGRQAAERSSAARANVRNRSGDTRGIKEFRESNA